MNPIMKFNSNMTIAFDDVLLVPQYSDIRSRKEVNLTTRLDAYRTFSLPIISSCMDTVTEDKMALAMNKAGGFGIIHRYNTIEKQVELFVNSDKRAMCAIGLGKEAVERVEALFKSGCQYFCIDVAHGHHILVKETLTELKSKFHGCHFMVGNVATAVGYDALVEWGADSSRVGIGGGSICSTRTQTGHGFSTLGSIMDIAGKSVHYNSSRKVALIADGGIRNAGDIVKAIAFGADFVMLGSLLSGHDESPGEVFIDSDNKQCYKIYRGMASKEAQINWRGYTSSLEGVSSKVRAKGQVNKTLNELETNIRSGLSYSGCRTPKELQQKFYYIQQTDAGRVESTTHILGSK